MKPKRAPMPAVEVRQTRHEDFPGIIALSQAVYSGQTPWREEQLACHLKHFPTGQLVAVETQTQRVVGMAASLIILWDDYKVENNWSQFTDRGYFTNHDPSGHTLYGAEVMVHPECQGCGLGKKLYAARRDIARRLKLRRIRAGARLRGYAEFAHEMTPEEYVRKVIAREIGDPTLTFQLKQGFRVIDVVRDYLSHDPASQGHAAVIEWINHEVAQRQDYRQRPGEYARHRKPHDAA